MANSFTTIRRHLFLLLVLISSALTIPSDELNTSSTSQKNLFTRLSRRNPPIRAISYPSGNNRNHVGSNQSITIKPASKRKSKKKHKKIPDIVSSTTKALKPTQPNSQPQSIPAEQSNTYPHSPPPVLNLNPSLPTYGAPSDEGSDIDRWVNGHNKVRRMYTVGDVTWSSKLAAAALQHSQTCYFKHTSNNQYGENIAAGQQSIEQVMKEWVFGQGERDSYVRSDPTSHSHYTQVVWADTKQIGCALTTCDQFGGASLGPGPIKFWVCEYDPPGNVIGWSAKEVHAATGGAPLSGYASKFRHKGRHEFSSKH